MDDYLGQKAALEKLVHGIAAEHGFAACEVAVNVADDIATGSIYLTRDRNLGAGTIGLF